MHLFSGLSRIIWKEYRAQRSVWLALLFGTILLQSLAFNPGELWPSRLSRAFFGAVEASKFKRLNTEFFGHFVNHGLNRHDWIGCSRRTVGTGLGFIQDYVVAVNLEIFQLIRPKRHHRASGNR